MTIHPLQRLYRAEELVRRRRSDEHRRHVASQRAARIDPNPHQIDAVVFALGRIPEGGCILADEVGLGKTIEAGLVIAQSLAEGARRVLVVTPKALLGQWQQELFALFAIDAHEVVRANLSFAGEGVFLATRELVGSEAGARALRDGERFDLCVVDEAHEVFAGVYRRFDEEGALREDSDQAIIAGRVLEAIRGTPVLLLTATPLQNSLLELWGLVHYVDPTGTLLGDLPTFRELFCPIDDRILAEGQDHELQRRLGTVLQRTLRRQAEEFMREPFARRQAKLFEYAMSADERALYDDVTRYLLEPELYAFRGNQRTLLLLGFHRRMASSLPALAASLEKVAERLRALQAGGRVDEAEDRAALLGDLEDDDELVDDELPSPGAHDAPRIAAELARVESFIARARALPGDSKADALLRAVRLVAEQAQHGRSSGKVVVFTESLTTQDYLRRLLVEGGVVTDDEITLFRGHNASVRARRALERWMEEEGNALPRANRPSPEVAMRLALVHEFRTRSRVFISTEAGAKGLNLQFCDTVINYDLPWNPQRIEQRIGRCHRYGQRRAVTVINFIARDNEAQRLTFEILSQKLDLFGTVLGATDEVLHRPGAVASESLAGTMGADFELQLRRVYERARTLDEVAEELRALREAMDARKRDFEAAVKRTEELIQRRFDSTVRATFRRIQAELPGELAQFDRSVEQVVVDYLQAAGIEHRLERRGDSVEVRLRDGAAGPAELTGVVGGVIGPAIAGSPLTPVHLGHPLVTAALAHARDAIDGRHFHVVIEARGDELGALRGRRGHVRLVRVRHRSLEETEELLPVVVLAGDDVPLPVELARALLAAPMRDAGTAFAAGVDETIVDDAVDELVFDATGESGRAEQPRFERALAQIERFIADRVLLVERRRETAAVRLAAGYKAREQAIGAEQRGAAERKLQAAQAEIEACDERLRALRAGDDERYRTWRRRTEERRYQPPELDRLFDAEIEIA